MSALVSARPIAMPNWGFAVQLMRLERVLSGGGSGSGSGSVPLEAAAWQRAPQWSLTATARGSSLPGLLSKVVSRMAHTSSIGAGGTGEPLRPVG